MIKSKNKIKVILTNYGAIETLELPLAIAKDSYKMAKIAVYVPITEQRTATSFVKVFASSINNAGERTWISEAFPLPYKAEENVKGFDYAVYEDYLPQEFCQVDGDLDLNFVYADLNEMDEAEDIITSTQSLHLFVRGDGLNQNGVKMSQYDATLARINLLSELSVLKVDISKELPLGVIFNKNAYKSPFYEFYTSNNEEANLEFLLPIKTSTFETKQVKIVANSIVKDKTNPSIIGYQTEFVFFDGGVCQRTNKYNIAQSSVNNYVLLEMGAWEIVNQEYITPLKEQIDQNTANIENLYSIFDTGLNYLGEYASQQTLPSDTELTNFVQAHFDRIPKSGDEFTFVLQVENGTDVIYLIKYSEFTSKWIKIPFPTIEYASNGNLGLITGTWDEQLSQVRLVKVNIQNGQIMSISSLNENGAVENISEHLNRNSRDIDLQGEEIETLENNLSSEITRASRAESELQTQINEEEARATASENANTQAIQNETIRATAEEGLLASSKIDKATANNNFIKNVAFSINGDNCVVNIEYKNPVTGLIENYEMTVTMPASESNAGLMTAEMVTALTNAIADIESLKYVGRQLATFDSYEEAELFDWESIGTINLTDYFIVHNDESRTEPTEHGETTRYVCVSRETPVTLDNFRFQSVVTTVHIQVATDRAVGGVLSTNSNGYIYVESNGAMKLVGYDAIITALSNLTTRIATEEQRSQQEDLTLSQAISAEETRAIGVEATKADDNLVVHKADDEQITGVKTFDRYKAKIKIADGDIRNILTSIKSNTSVKRYLIMSGIGDDTSAYNAGCYQENGKLYSNSKEVATIDQIPTKTSDILNDAIPNPNLFINGDFTVNTRGQSSYTGNDINCADWWLIYGCTATPQSDGGIVITNSTTARIFQRVNHQDKLWGKQLTMTFSVNGVAKSYTFTLPSTKPSANASENSGYDGDGYRLRWSFYSNTDILAFLLDFTNTDEKTIDWAKLEFGSVATPFYLRTYSEEMSNCGGLIDDKGNKKLFNDIATIAELPNANLLINGDFSVNTRGKSSYSAVGYSVNNWQISNGTGGSLTYNVSTKTLTNSRTANSHFIQKILDNDFPWDKTITVSFSANGIVYSQTMSPISKPSDNITIGTSTAIKDSNNVSLGACRLYHYVSGTVGFTFDVYAGKSYSVEWAKLEVGSVATPLIPVQYPVEMAHCGSLVNDEGKKKLFNDIDTIISKPSQLGLTEPCTMSDLTTAIINQSLKNAQVRIANENFSLISDTPSGYGVLCISTGMANRMWITYMADIGTTSSQIYIGFLNRSATPYTVDWTKYLVGNKDLTLTVPSGTDRFIEIKTDDATTPRLKIRATDANFTVLNSGTYYFRDKNNATSGAIISPGEKIRPESNAQMDLGANSYRWKDLYLSGDAIVGGNLTDGENSVTVEEIKGGLDNMLNKATDITFSNGVLDIYL